MENLNIISLPHKLEQLKLLVKLHFDILVLGKTKSATSFLNSHAFVYGLVWHLIIGVTDTETGNESWFVA